jgi:DNA replication protein DnaC
MSATTFDFEADLLNVIREPDVSDEIAKLVLPRPARWQYRTGYDEQDADRDLLSELIGSAMDRGAITPHLSDRLSFAFILARSSHVAVCSKCKAEFRYLARWLPIDPRSAPELCDQCDRVQTHERDKAVAEIEQRYREDSRKRAFIEANVPTEYRRAIVPAQLPNQRAFYEVTSWLSRWGTCACDLADAEESEIKNCDHRPHEEKGILLVGKTGTAKTRASYQLLINAFLAGAIDDFLAISSTELKQAAVNASKPGAEKHEREDAEKLIKTARTCDALLIDDLHQAKFSPKYSETLFEIVEHRTANGLPLFLTIQLGGKAFLRKVAGDDQTLLQTGEALVRRFDDYCHYVDFDQL